MDDRRTVAAVPLDAAAVRLWTRAALDALGEARSAIDSLNVFPVPDGDTGTNMFLTLEAGCAGVEEASAAGGAGESGAAPDLARVARALARGALLGARGNSGVILSQILRGIGEVLAEIPEGAVFDAAIVRSALRRAADGAYGAVAEPVEGTILTVARAAAEAAEAYPGVDALGAVEQASAAAHDALARTTEQLPALRAAGVVDSGGQGLVVVYDALVDVVTGVRRRRPRIEPRRQSTAGPGPAGGRDDPAAAIEPGGPDFEVMYLFDGDGDAVGELRTRLLPLGDSLVISGETPLWNVHVHVHEAGPAIEAALDLGRPHRIAVTYLPDRPPRTPVAAAARGIVAVAHGPGVAALLAESGVAVVPAQPHRRPSTAEILDGIARTGAAEVVVLPSDSDTLPVAEAAAEAARGEGTRVTVIPTRSVVQSLAALAVHDPGARFDDVVVAMTRAAGATRYGAVTIAVREALTSAGRCEVGDVLGLADGDIVEIGPDLTAVSWRVLERLLASSGELVTLVTGAAAPAGIVDALSDLVTDARPGTEIVVVDGGQPLWPLILGVE